MPSANVTRAAWRQRQRWLKYLVLAAAGIFMLKLLLSVLMSDMGIFKLFELRQARHELQQDLAELQVKNSKLTEQINALRSDPFYIEMLAREQLGMVRPGEQVYRLVPPERTSP